MNYTYDPEADALYVTVATGEVARQIDRADGVIVDLDALGRPIGFDIMNPLAGWDVQALVIDYGLTPDDVDLLSALAAVRWRVEAPTAVASRSSDLQHASSTAA